MRVEMGLVCFLTFLFSCFAVAAYASHSSPSYDSDQEALLSFKGALSSDSQNSLFDWSPHQSHCNWTGIVCSSHHRRVVSLNLTGMSLQGPISPFLGNLSFLRLLSLKNNSIEGYIPSQLGRLFRLRILRLSMNKLEGSIPSALAGCHSLQVLILSYNNLSGSIPSQLGLLSHLETLILGLNDLTGTIPPSLGNLSSLTYLELSHNRFHGGIPIELGMLTQLRELYLTHMHLTGSIPVELGMLTQLTDLSLDANNLRGVIPVELFNCNLLQNLTFTGNQLSGQIPWQIGKLSNLQQLYLSVNQLTGEIPKSLFNCTQLQLLELESNQLSGELPLEFGNLHQLLVLSVWENHFVSKSNDLSIITALTNCSYLQELDLSMNDFTGILPSSIGQLSNQLSEMRLYSNKFEGNIPSSISNLTMLTFLVLSDNRFNGTIPSSLGQLPHLERLFLGENNLYGSIPKGLAQAKKLGLLSLDSNMLSGTIPNSLGGLQQLRYLFLYQNQLSGEIPASLGRCQTLEVVDLSHNKLNGNIPAELASLKNIQFYFNISNNSLQGNLLEMSKMIMAQAIDVSLNRFSGEIPVQLSNCVELQYLNLSWNSFDGPIPASFTSLKSLAELDLSRNNLSGKIPATFQEMKALLHINLSSNQLVGEVPKKGVFATIDESAIMGNPGLCGKWINLHPCSNDKQKHILVSKKVIVPVTIGIGILIMSIVLLVILHRRPIQDTPDLKVGPKIISYEELVDATGGFNEGNLIGVGSFGSVYKGILNSGTHIAVKVLNLQDESAVHIFSRECNVLKRVRHRNVIKIVSVCSSPDFKALVLPFMSNGSLDRWLYGEEEDECKLKLAIRLRIAKEIAQGIEYLHHHCFVQVIHCDLKPSNVLLGDDMTAHIADFGITKILFENSINSLTSTHALKGTTGYIAPEYGMGENISTKGDVYSYGILLLELLTRKRPIDDMFVEGINLSKWVGMAFPNKIVEVVDNNMLRDVNESELSMVLSCLTQFMQVGLACTRELPQQRPNMREIVKRLEKITIEFLGTPSLQLPIDISPFLESTSGLKNTNLERDESWSTS